MSLKNEYLLKVYEGVKQRDASEPEFLQAVLEVQNLWSPLQSRIPELKNGELWKEQLNPKE